MKKYLLFLLGYILSCPVFSQGYIGPSPDATALMRQANVGVNYYTGSSVISISLGQLSGRELGVTASLSYNSAGNRVQDVSSSVGLGWTLSAGGMITRVVRGEPDDLKDGFCTAGRTDPEPDLFFFSFMGRSGKFVLDASGSPVIYPFQDIIIKPGVCQVNNQIWEIVDENGVRYLFGETSSSRETTTTKMVTGGSSKSYISTWHLSKVISPNGTDEMTLSYFSSTMSYINYFFTQEDGCVSNKSVKDESTKITINACYLSSITTSGGYMYFTWNSNRQDISGGRYLENIRVNNRSGNQVSKLRFGYGYFQSSGCSTELCKRLRLDKIYDLSSAPMYSFQYNTTVNLPSRDSKHFDHWGYYNNNTVNSWIPADPYVGLSGASRSPDATKMQANILTRIDEREGSYQLFTYEANNGIKDGQTYIVSGSRIKSIETGDGKGNKYSKNYTYTKSGSSETSGLLFRLPSYSVYLASSLGIVAMRRYSHAYSELLDVNGVAMGYSRVEESISGNGKMVYTFTNYDTNPDLIYSGNGNADAPPFASITSLFWERGNPLTVSVYNEQSQLVSEETYEYTFDHPNKKQVSGTKSLSLSYSTCGKGSGSISSTYHIISRPFTVKKKSTAIFDQATPTKKTTNISEFNYDATTYQLVTLINYNSALPDEKYITKFKYITHEDFSFNRMAYCEAQTVQCYSYSYCGGNPTCHENCRNSIYTSCMNAADPRQRAILIMRNRHMNNVLVEEQNWLEKNSIKRLLGASLNIFNLHPQNAAVIIQSSKMKSEKHSGSFAGSNVNTNGSFVIPSQYHTTAFFNSYDGGTGKLLQVTGRDGIQNQYVWDHNGTLIKTVTTVGGNLQQIKGYEYKPLIGTTKETDINGIAIYSEYDALGRLRLVRDTESNIISRYRYHFKGETPSFILSSNKQQVNTNESISFSISDAFASTGTSTNISWDMGDGRTYTDNRQSFSLSYPTSGTYTVKATLSSPEYAPITKSLVISIRKPLQISVCVDGPRVIDLCTKQVMIYGSCTAFNNTPSSNIELVAAPVVGSGCTGAYTYKWEYKLSTSSNWTLFGASQQRVIFPGYRQVGNYEVRCTVTDVCGQTAVGSHGISFYKSKPNCSVPLNSLPLMEQFYKYKEDSNATIEDMETVGNEEGSGGEGKALPFPTGTPYGIFATSDEAEEH